MTIHARFPFTLLVAALSCCGGGSGTADGPTAAPSFTPNFLSPDVRLDSPRESASVYPKVACAGSRVYAVWMDYRSSLLVRDIRFNRSLDGGRTWLAADVRLDTDAPGATDSLEPRIACSGDTVCVVWYEKRGTKFGVYFNRSLDAGVSWSPSDVQLDGDLPSPADSTDPDIAADGSDVHVVWADKSAGAEDVHCRSSSDRGCSWSAETRLDTGSLPGAAASRYPRVRCSGTTVAAAWQDFRNQPNGNVYANGSVDGGATWLPSDARLDTIGPAGLPDIACDGLRVFVAWQDWRGGNGDVYLRSSPDGGATWSTSEQRLDGDEAGYSDGPRIACRGESVYVVWLDVRESQAGVFFRRSTDAGATWPSPERRLDASGKAYFPTIACSGSNVYVTWEDLRDDDGSYENTNVYFTYSTDEGTTWAADRRIDTDPATDGAAWRPQVCADGNGVYVAWFDNRNGLGDVYFTASPP